MVGGGRDSGNHRNRGVTLPRRLPSWPRAVLGVMCGLVLGHASPGGAFWDGLWGADCSQWNTPDFFAHATVEVVTDCLGDGIDPAARDNTNKTPLHWAAAYAGDAAVVEVLLGADADPVVRDYIDTTPLHFAAMQAKTPAVVTALLDAGADPMARMFGDITPLHLAALRA